MSTFLRSGMHFGRANGCGPIRAAGQQCIVRSGGRCFQLVLPARRKFQERVAGLESTLLSKARTPRRCVPGVREPIDLTGLCRLSALTCESVPRQRKDRTGTSFQQENDKLCAAPELNG